MIAETTRIGGWRTGLTLALCALWANVLACGGATSSFTGPQPGAAVIIGVEWRLQPTDTEFGAFRPRELGGVAYASSPSPLAVVAATNGDLIAYDATTRDEVWRVNFGGAMESPPFVSDDVVFAGGPDETLRAIRLADGEEIWRYRGNGAFYGSPSVAGELVVAMTSAGTLVAVDRATGELAWSVERDPTGDLVIQGECKPAFDGSAIYAGFSDGTLSRISLEGDIEWTADLAAGNRRLIDVDGEPLVADGVVYAGSFSGGFYAIDASDGSQLWSIDVEGASGATMVGGRVVTATADGVMLWIDPSTGTIVHELHLDANAPMTPVPAGPYLLVSSVAGGLYVVDQSMPWIHSRFQPDTGFSSLPVAHGDRVIALSNRGYLYSLRLSRR